MVDIEIASNEVVVRLRGLHRLWALKSEVRIPRAQLKSVELAVTQGARARLSRSVRLPGTSIPSLITAGSYRCDGQWAFWDVTGKGDSAVTLTTDGHQYREVVVDVADPIATVAVLQSLIGFAPERS